MERFSGTSVLEKIAIGKIYYYESSAGTPYREDVEDVEAEIARFEAAREAASAELEGIAWQAEAELGRDHADIFFGHRMILDDPMYREFVCKRIRERRVNAEYAVAAAQAHFMQMLMVVDDEYVRGRAPDVADVSGRLMRLLAGEAAMAGPEEPSILAAGELTPSDVMRLNRQAILGIITSRGTPNSHAAIIARARGIPAILGVDISEDWSGRTAVVDGLSGTVILDPDEECLARMREEKNKIDEQEAMRAVLIGMDTVTGSGRKIDLYANIGDLSEIDEALANDAEGVGLFRSEFLCMQEQEWPDEEEQFEVYRAVVGSMGERRVVIRTFDVNGDKQIPGMDLTEQVKLGQLRAILRAAEFGTVAVMFPMISSPEELRSWRKLIGLAREDLVKEGIPFGDIEVGIMVETPGAVSESADLAREADFFCIGTNDLVPSLLGVSRQEAMGSGIDQRDPAVTQAIRTAIENGHEAGIWVGICGEMAADTSMTEELVAMGVDELSVAPSSILKVRETVRGIE